MTCILPALAATVILVLGPPAFQAQLCDGRTEHRVDQEQYLGVTDRVYVYAPDINSLGKSGGWDSFSVRILIGEYRTPLLIPKGFLKERDLQVLLASRRDIKQTVLQVPGFDPRRSKATPPPVQATVKNGEKPGTITIRIARVVPVSGGTDHVFLVCTGGR